MCSLGNPDIANNLTQLTFSAVGNCCPVWMPDGERVVFTSFLDSTLNLYVKNADGTGDAEPLTEGPDLKVPYDVTGDGTTVVFTVRRGGVHTLSLDGQLTTSTLVQTESVVGRLRLSPDGRWIAHEIDERGEIKVVVRPFPDIEGGRWDIGGHSPLWSPDGRELFYYSDGTMWAVPFDTEPSFRAGNPQPLFQGTYQADPLPGLWPFDIAPDGRFLMRKPGGATVDAMGADLVLVQNFFDELQRLVPVP